MPISPKIIKPEPLKNEQQYSTQYSVNNLVSNVHTTENGRNISKFTATPVMHSVSILNVRPLIIEFLYSGRNAVNKRFRKNLKSKQKNSAFGTE